MLNSDTPLESSVALAAINAAWAHRLSRSRNMVTGDVLERVALRDDDDVAMIGYFGPLVKPIREKVRSLAIADIEAEKADEVKPAGQAADILGQASVAFITSTSLLNGSCEKLLDASSGCREVVMLGATTPLIPEVFRDTPVTWLCGVLSREPSQLLTTVSEGGGMCYFKRYVRKVNVRVPERLDTPAARRK